MTQSLFIHVGYPKTGTSLIQKYFLSKHPDIAFIGKPTNDPTDSLLFQLKREILFTIDSNFKPNKIREKFQKLFNDHKPKDRDENFGISLESFTGYPLIFDLSQKSICERINQVFQNDKIKIIIGIRNQKTIIPSYYATNVQDGETSSLRSILFSPQSRRRNKFLRNFNYSKVINIYNSCFGTENVHVYLKEYLNDDFERLFREINNFLDIEQHIPEIKRKINSRISKICILFLRYLISPNFVSYFNEPSPLNPINLILNSVTSLIQNFGSENNPTSYRILGGPENYHSIRTALNKKIYHLIKDYFLAFDRRTFGKVSSFQYKLPEDLKKFIHKHFAPSNNSLKINHQLPLKHYNYPLPS